MSNINRWVVILWYHKELQPQEPNYANSWFTPNPITPNILLVFLLTVPYNSYNVSLENFEFNQLINH